MSRISSVVWSNKVETSVKVQLCIDGKGLSSIKTGHNTIDHLLASFARYGRFNLDVSVDSDGIMHHRFEHVGIAMGNAFSEAIGNRDLLTQFYRATLPMDEALADIVVDVNHSLGGFVYHKRSDINDLAFSHDGVETFCYLDLLDKMMVYGKINMHILNLYANDVHHAIEVLYKTAAYAIYKATRFDENPIPRLNKSKGE